MKRQFTFCWKILYRAISNFMSSDSMALASHVALSGLMALFPFLIFATSLAAFIGDEGMTDRAVTALFDILPPNIAGPIAGEVQNVLNVQRGGLLTISVLMTAYFASNGVEAFRIALNRAYQVEETRSFILNRIQSIGFVMLGTISLAVIGLLLVLAPLMMRIAIENFPVIEQFSAAIVLVRYFIAAIVLLAGLYIAHKWLPAGTRKLSDILPGSLITLAAWMLASFLFGLYLSTFANYVSTYAGLASIMVAIIFFNMLAVIFIFGAQINAAIMYYRDRPQQEGQVTLHSPD